MNFQPYQLMTFGIFLMLAVTFWKVDNKYIRIFIVAVAFVLFALNPFRYKQEGVSLLERNTVKFEYVPEKVIIEQKSFEERQTNAYDDLKQQTQDRKNEIHN